MLNMFHERSWRVLGSARLIRRSCCKIGLLLLYVPLVVLGVYLFSVFTLASAYI